jgi:quercetin dioxygenase-like cupin family protein
MSMQTRAYILSAIATGIIIFFGAAAVAAVPSGPCRPVSDRTSEVGCWVLSEHPIGELAESEVFWHLDAYSSRSAAEAAKSPMGTVVESFGRIWLFTIAENGWQAPGGQAVAEIGPLAINAHEQYSVVFLEAVFTPGMTVPGHIHSGPEAWYTLAGETCVETPEGKQVGRPGGKNVIVPAGLPMHLTATGTENRRSLVLLLHESAKPDTTWVPDWTPKGLCKN